MTDPLQAALDSISDGDARDWHELQAAATDAQTKGLLDALADIATIAAVHAAGVARGPQPTPFRWGPLDVRRWLARGAHGDVFQAWDPRLERDVALKLLRDSTASRDDTAIEEGRLLARVRHHNVVTIFGADVIDGQAGIWMEFLAGRTVADAIASRGAFSLSQAIAVTRDVCAGLSAIHRAGLIHRDVKAHNVVLTDDGRTVLMDLGASSEHASQSGHVAGTPVYLAPEVLAGGRPSIASEVYAVGVLLYLMIAGTYPCGQPASLDELKAWHQRPDGRRLRFDAAVPPRLREILARALARDPVHRYESIEALGSAITDVSGVERPPYSHRLWTLSIPLTAMIVVLLLPLARSVAARVPRDGTRIVRAPAFELGSPSSDGRLYPFVDTAGNLRLWDVAGGDTRLVATHEPDAELRAPVLSPDGTQVVRTTRWNDGSSELTVSTVDAQWPRSVILRQAVYEPMTVDWSRDGTLLLSWLKEASGGLDLAVVPLSGQPPRVLLSLPTQEPPAARFSPDSRSVIAVRPRGPRRDIGELVVVPVSGGPVHTLFEGEITDSFPMWLPDGRLFFMRGNADPVRDGWITTLGADGYAQPPTRVIRDLRRYSASEAFAVTDGGELQALVTSRAADIYLADLAPRPAAIHAAAVRIDPVEVGNHVAPAWSPDGRSIAYFTNSQQRNLNATPVKTLTLRTLATSAVRRFDTLPLRFLSGYQPRWSPDSRTLVVFGSDSGDRKRLGYYEVDVSTGRVEPLVITGGSAEPAIAQWSSDGRAFLFQDVRGIVSLDVATARQTVVVAATAGDSPGRFAVSRSGAIAWVRWLGDLQAPVGSILMTRDENGTDLELVRTDADAPIDLEGWMPDGHAILYGRGRPSLELWKISASGGPPRDLHQAIPATVNPLTISPDGRRIAYTEQHVAPELWIRRLPR